MMKVEEMTVEKLTSLVKELHHECDKLEVKVTAKYNLSEELHQVVDRTKKLIEEGKHHDANIKGTLSKLSQLMPDACLGDVVGGEDDKTNTSQSYLLYKFRLERPGTDADGICGMCVMAESETHARKIASTRLPIKEPVWLDRDKTTCVSIATFKQLRPGVVLVTEVR